MSLVLILLGFSAVAGSIGYSAHLDSQAPEYEVDGDYRPEDLPSVTFPADYIFPCGDWGHRRPNFSEKHCRDIWCANPNCPSRQSPRAIRDDFAETIRPLPGIYEEADTVAEEGYPEEDDTTELID